MAISVKHPPVAGPNDPTKQVSKTVYEQDHDLTGTPGGVPFVDSGGTLTEDTAKLKFGTAAGQGLTANAGTATTDVQALSITQTWNNAAITYGSFKMVITDAASAAGSLPWQILGGAAGETNLIRVDKAGAVVTGIGTISAPALQFGGVGFGLFAFNAGGDVGFGGGGGSTLLVTTNNVRINSVAPYQFSSTTSAAGSADTGLSRISAGLIGVGTGGPGSFAGSLKLTGIQVAGSSSGVATITAPAAAGTPTLTLPTTTGTFAQLADITASEAGQVRDGDAASGDLAGTYPGPTVTQARGLLETGGPTTLAVGAVADGEFLKRVGATVIGANPGAASLTLTTVEVDLGTQTKRAGKFNITTTGLTAGRPVLIVQANGPYTGKGTLTDEAEMDGLVVSGKTTSTTNIECYWKSATFVKGNIKFDYAAG